MPPRPPVITFAPAKSEWNARERGMPFTLAARFDFDTSFTVEDDREDYGRERFMSVGRIGREVVMLIYTPTPGRLPCDFAPQGNQERTQPMARISPMTELDPPELTDEQLARLRPTRKVLSPEQYAAVTGRGRPKVPDPKVPVTIRLDRAVVEALKATGAGWQTRLNAKLRQDLLGS